MCNFVLIGLILVVFKWINIFLLFLIIGLVICCICKIFGGLWDVIIIVFIIDFFLKLKIIGFV